MTAIVELSFVTSLDNWMESMNTFQQLKAQIDLRRIVAQDLGPAPCRGTASLRWNCPNHHEQRGFSLAVWPDLSHARRQYLPFEPLRRVSSEPLWPLELLSQQRDRGHVTTQCHLSHPVGTQKRAVPRSDSLVTKKGSASVIDVQQIKASVDLRRIVAQDLGPAPRHSTHTLSWKCPFHHEQHGFSLVVWPDGFRCFGACQASGDVLTWLQRFRGLTFSESLRLLGAPALQAQPPRQPAAAQAALPPAEPPSEEWQHQAREVVDLAEQILWSDAGDSARAWLRKRGLGARVVQEARLGLIPGDYRAWKPLAGLQVPCGILIPWFAAGQLWAVKVRRAAGQPKYVQIAGGSPHGLYGADWLPSHDIAVFCEGEFDALLLRQEARPFVAPVTLGSAAAQLSARWMGELLDYERLFIAYDNDVAGQRAAERLLRLSPRFCPLPVPDGKDITDFHLRGGSIRDWIRAAIYRQGGCS